MNERDLYEQILAITAPWHVTSVEFRKAVGQVTVFVAPEQDSTYVCPTCGSEGPGYDSRTRRWRHLDTCQYRTVIEATVPRMTCPTHGVVMLAVPWAETGRYTALFEAHVIDWLKETSILAVSRQLHLSWTAIANLQRRAVERGLARRKKTSSQHICVDETSFRKRHDYVTVVSDGTSGTVLHVAEDRQKSSLKDWYEGLDEAKLGAIESVSMDMWKAYIHATLEVVPGAKQKTCFDSDRDSVRLHVAKHLGDAIDLVRRQENRYLISEGNRDLVGTKYNWLKNSANMTHREWSAFEWLRESSHKTARAWAIKELGMSKGDGRSPWHYASRTWARKAWKKWYSWAIRSRLEPIKKAARMVKKHLWGIINAVVLGASNGPAESINSRIKAIKVKSRGFRNKQRFANAPGERLSPYFHLGGLDLYPAGAR